MGHCARVSGGGWGWFAAGFRRAAAVACLALAGAASVIAAATAAAAPATMRVQVYFNNQDLAGRPDDCATVFAVARQLPRSAGVATAALNALFVGPTEVERAAGYRSPFSAATAGLLRSLRVDHGTAYLNLNDPRALLAGATSSCGAAEFRTQLESTLRQFPTVRRVIVAIDGEPRTFYEWMGDSCDLSNDHCDAAPFRHGR
jgi:spore germination protein GerM